MPPSPATPHAPATAPSLAFFFDFISPYAYVAWKGIRAVGARHGRTVEVVPVLFAAILDAHGQKGPAEIPAKREFTFRDAYRKAHRAGLPPLRPPPSHPFNPLLALRVASVPMDRDASYRLVDALFDAAWMTGSGVETAERVGEAIVAAGLDAPTLLAEATSAEGKARVRAATDAAIARGAFGVPTMIADGELFWGTDGLEFLDAFLRGEDPVPRDLAWAQRPTSATRPGSRR